MDQIAAKAGASKATVYSHFRSKEELLSAVIDNLLEPIQIAMNEPPKDDGFAEWLINMGRQIGRQAMSAEGIALSRLAIAEALRLPEIGRALNRHGFAAVEVRLRPEIERAMARGVLRKTDPQIALAHLCEMSFGRAWRDVLMGMRAPPTEDQLERDVRLAVAAFMRGYVAD